MPPPRLCTDNGVMVAWAAVEQLHLGRAHVAEGQEVRARWPLGRLADGVKISKPGSRGQEHMGKHPRKAVAN